MLQNGTALRKSAPGPPNTSDSCVSCPLQMSYACQRFWNCYKPSRFAHLWRGAESLAPATWNDIWTSKSAPRMVCFVHFAFEMCFAPQPLQHLNFQKCSEPGVFCNVLCILTWTCASRHNGVHFFISHLPRWLRTPRFSEPILVDPPEPQNIGKTQCFATCLPFRAPASSFFWLFLLSAFCFLLSAFCFLLSAFWSSFFFSFFSSLLFSSLLFSGSSHLCLYYWKFDF